MFVLAHVAGFPLEELVYGLVSSGGAAGAALAVARVRWGRLRRRS